MEKIGQGGIGEVYKAVDRRLDRTADRRWITPDYLDTLGATMLSGRTFDEDSDLAPIVIDETLAEVAFPGVDPIGRQLRTQPLGEEDAHSTVIVVVRRVRRSRTSI